MGLAGIGWGDRVWAVRCCGEGMEENGLFGHYGFVVCRDYGVAGEETCSQAMMVL